MTPTRSDLEDVLVGSPRTFTRSAGTGRRTRPSFGGITSVGVFPLKLIRAMFIGMDPPRHDQLKMLFQAGFTPKRIGSHEPAIRAIVDDVLDRLEGRERGDLVTEVAQPAVSRVIGSFMGIPPEDDAVWARIMNSALAVGDPDMSPEGVRTLYDHDIPELFERCGRMIAERRERPTDDLTSVLVHAEIDGEQLDEQEIVMGSSCWWPPATTVRRRRIAAACARCSRTPSSAGCC